MIKKCLLTGAVCMLVLLAGCSGNPQEKVSVPSESIQQSSEEPQRDMDAIVRKAFSDLWKSDVIYIDAEMTVEETEVSESKSVYRYIIAADGKKKSAALEIEQQDTEKVHCIIRDNVLYRINDEGKSYTTEEYKGKIEDFVKAYTKDMNLSETSMSREDTGLTPFNGQKEIEFVKYRIAVESGSDKITVTYYLKDEKPYAEVMQSERGKTTILFRSLTNKIADKTIFEVPEDYENLS